MSGVATAGRRDGSLCARCGRPARLAAVTNVLGAPTLKRGDVSSGVCRCPVVDVSINAGGVDPGIHLANPRAFDDDTNSFTTSHVRANGPSALTQVLAAMDPIPSSSRGKKRRAEEEVDAGEVNEAVTQRKKARIDNTTSHLTSHLSPHQGTQLSAQSPRHILTSHASAKYPRSSRARSSTPRTPASSRVKPKTRTPRTDLTAAVPLDLQPLGRHNDQRASIPSSSTFTVRSPTYGSRALLGPTSLGALLEAAKSSPTPSSSVLSPSSAWRESSRSPSTSSRSPVFSSRSALGSPGAASPSTVTTQGILRRWSPGHLDGRLGGQSLGGAASALGFEVKGRALNSAERAILAWVRSRETQIIEVGGRPRDFWRAMKRSGKMLYRNELTGAIREALPLLGQGGVFQPRPGVDGVAVMCELFAGDKKLTLVLARKTAQARWRSNIAAHLALVPVFGLPKTIEGVSQGGVNVVVVNTEDAVSAIVEGSTIAKVKWARVVVDDGDFLCDPKLMSTRAITRLNAASRLADASRWVLPTKTLKLTRMSLPVVCAAIRVCSVLEEITRPLSGQQFDDVLDEIAPQAFSA